MNDVVTAAKQRMEEIRQQLKKIESMMPPPIDGTLRITHSRGKVRYYHCTSGGQKYLRQSETSAIEQLANRSYLVKLREAFEGEQAVLKQFMNRYHPADAIGLYEALSPARKQIVVPADLTDEAYIESWRAAMMKRFRLGANTFYPGDKYKTQCGEYVRSKSELILANLFHMNQIPYFYELPLELERHVIFPDFTLLNVRERKTYYWEHFGMLSDEKYANDAIAKLALYEEGGHYENIDLLISRESSEESLNTGIAERKISRFLL
ncbi:MAG: hypothetical protein IK088_08135 [Lachnospiraceae bacterium]|nr:hypothetical protein [Lachnospiraceae bacterium]